MVKEVLYNQPHRSIEYFKNVFLPAEKRADLIESTNWMSDFQWPQITRFADFVDIYEIGQGEMLYVEGNREAYMGLIAKGYVNVKKQDADGNLKVIAALGPGKTFGEMSLIDGQPRSAFVKTSTAVTLVVLTKAKFDDLIQGAPLLAVKIILKISKLMSERLRQTSGRLIDYLED